MGVNLIYDINAVLGKWLPSTYAMETSLFIISPDNAETGVFRED